MSVEAEAVQRTEEQEEQLTKVFLDFLAAQDEGYQGSFEEYYWDRFGELSPTIAMRAGWAATEEDTRVRHAALPCFKGILLLASLGCSPVRCVSGMCMRRTCCEQHTFTS